MRPFLLFFIFGGTSRTGKDRFWAACAVRGGANQKATTRLERQQIFTTCPGTNKEISTNDELDDGSSVILMDSRTHLVFVQVMSLQCIKVWRGVERCHPCAVSA
jgi:hypothetical protein